MDQHASKVYLSDFRFDHSGQHLDPALDEFFIANIHLDAYSNGISVRPKCNLSEFLILIIADYIWIQSKQVFYDVNPRLERMCSIVFSDVYAQIALFASVTAQVPRSFSVGDKDEGRGGVATVCYCVSWLLPVRLRTCQFW